MAIKIGISTIRTVLQNGFSIKKDDSQKSKNVDPKKLCKKINPKNNIEIITIIYLINICKTSVALFNMAFLLIVVVLSFIFLPLVKIFTKSIVGITNYTFFWLFNFCLMHLNAASSPSLAVITSSFSISSLVFG